MISIRTHAPLLLLLVTCALQLSSGQIHWNRGWGAGGTLGKRSYPRFYPHPWTSSLPREWGSLVDPRHMRKAEPAHFRPLDKLVESYSHSLDRKQDKFLDDGGSAPQGYISEAGSVLEPLETGDENQKEEKSVNERNPLRKEALDLSSVMLAGNEGNSCSVDATVISTLLAQLVHAEALRVIECRTSAEELGHLQLQDAQQ
ncbi:hypothetical protein FHG87_018569 [Trinorchestia longiramus]|nr:hypothetical protein FHG87_018569 [Trinorchestia longiramus]